MPTFFTASLLTIVVVAGIAALWLRGRSNNSKKRDEEASGDSGVEIVVENDKPKSVTKAAASSTLNQSSASIANAITNTLSLDLVNRRQYVKAVCDRFESWTSKAMDSEENEEDMGQALVRPVGLHDQDSAPANAASAFRSKSKPNNLSSFVRQCVSNIERTTFVSSNRTISPRNSMTSNQADSPPKTGGRRLPSHAAATDYKLQDDYDPEEYAVEEEAFAKPLLSRTPSDLARTNLGKPPLLVPFAATRARPSTPLTLPPVWARMVKQEAPAPSPASAPVVKAAEPEDDESPIDVTAQSTLMFATQDDEPTEPMVIPPPPRKVSNSAARLQQFQQLVPSNQARVAY